MVPDAKHDANFLLCVFDKESAQIRLLAGKQARSNYQQENLRGYLITIPTLPEQRKIADFLTAVDGRIEQLSQKKALLEDYKKGVMQQLFTQALRFKDKVNGKAREGTLGCDHGNDFPEWEETTLGEIGSVVGGGTPDSTNDTYWNGDVQWFTPTEIRSKFVSRSKRTISTSGLRVPRPSSLLEHYYLPVGQD